MRRQARVARNVVPMPVDDREATPFIGAEAWGKVDEHAVVGEGVLRGACRGVGDSLNDLDGLTVRLELFRIEPDRVQRIAANVNEMPGRQIPRVASASDDDLPLAALQVLRDDRRVVPRTRAENRVENRLAARQRVRPTMRTLAGGAIDPRYDRRRPAGSGDALDSAV